MTRKSIFEAIPAAEMEEHECDTKKSPITEASIKGAPLEREMSKRWRDIPWKLVFAKKIVANKYFMRSGLIRKDLLPLYTNPGVDTPITHLISKNNIQEKLSLSSSTNKWILKFADSSNGYGIKILEEGGDDVTNLLKADEFDSSTNDESPPRVLQQYLSPKLLGGKKFHFRVIVLAVGELDVFVYDNIRVLIATEDYIDGDYDNQYRHLTNQSINNRHPDYNESLQNVALEDSSTSLDVKFVHQEIRCIVKSLFHKLSKNRRHFFTLPNCYEVFGLDFMMDDRDKIWLLEANPDPSMSMYSSFKSWSDVLQTTNPVENKKEINDQFHCVYSKNKMEALEKLKQGLLRRSS